jgi:hypothetical protein
MSMWERNRGYVLAVLLGLVFLGCSREEPKGDKPPQDNNQPATESVDLFQARQGFRTTLIPNAYKSDGPAADPPPQVFRKVHYPSPAGKLVAYVSPDPGDGKKHPALVWAHGGFGGIDASMANPTSTNAPFRAAGLIVMCPSWRGENDNPGKYEMF